MGTHFDQLPVAMELMGAGAAHGKVGRRQACKQILKKESEVSRDGGTES